jgi:hypothetical protein
LYLTLTDANPAPGGWVAEDLPEFPQTETAPRGAVLPDDVYQIVQSRSMLASPRAPRGEPSANGYQEVTAVGSPALLQGIGQPDKAAHLRALVGPVATRFGNRTLKIWVADDCWTGGGKPYVMTQAMVNAVAGAFLSAGADNDLYDAITTITGPEYGELPQGRSPDLVPFNGEIHLFFFDHEAWDSRAGVGHFTAGPQIHAFEELTQDTSLDPMANTTYLLGKSIAGSYHLHVAHRNLSGLKIQVIARPSSG